MLGSLKRTIRKKKTLKALLNSEQFNNSVVNIHRYDKTNVGDYYCAPHHYFDQLKGKFLDIYDYKSENKDILENFILEISTKALIIGGGGLLNRSSFEKQLKLFEALQSKGKKTVLWGVGHNSKHKSDFGSITSYNINLKNFGLVGTRDFKMPGEFLPCVSCMHPIFDKDYSETQEIGIIYHKKTLKKKQLIKKLEDYPSTSNTTDLEDMVSFIGKSNRIVTDSYHAMYWSMLLGKKVAVIPNSSKFFDFKYQPVVTSFENFENDIKNTNTFTGLLEESRELNTNFSEKVFNYLNI